MPFGFSHIEAPDNLGDIICDVLSSIAMPFHWTETLIFWILGLPTSTSFRMFPPADVVPGYPIGVAYSYALMAIPFIPYFLYFDRRLDGGANLGAILRPYTRAASPRIEAFIMMARVWLAAAWVNMATAEFMTSNRFWWYYVGVWGIYFIL